MARRKRTRALRSWLSASHRLSGSAALLCRYGTRSSQERGWRELPVPSGLYWRDDAWHSGDDPLDTPGLDCPGPTAQRRLRAFMEKNAIANARKLPFGLSFNPFKIKETCECGEPTMYGGAMCPRCAFLDYGATEPKAAGRAGTVKQRVIDCLRDMQIASTSEIHNCAGERHVRQTQRALYELVEAGRLRNFRCGDISGVPDATCYELDISAGGRGHKRRAPRHR